MMQGLGELEPHQTRVTCVTRVKMLMLIKFVSHAGGGGSSTSSLTQPQIVGAIMFKDHA